MGEGEPAKLQLLVSDVYVCIFNPICSLIDGVHCHLSLLLPLLLVVLLKHSFNKENFN